MIENVYFTRIVNDDKCYGFGVTESGQQVYIPGQLVENFDLTVDDVGTKNKMALTEDRTGKTEFTAVALLIEDSALHQAYEWAKEEIERLQDAADRIEELEAKLEKAVEALGTALDEMVDYADTHPSLVEIWGARETARTTLTELKA